MAALQLSSAALRACFLGASAAVHLVAFAGFGHAPPSPAREATRSESIPIDDLAPSIEDLGPDPAPHAERRARPTAPPHHTHSYPIAADHDARPHDPSLVHVPAAPARDEALVPVPASVDALASDEAPAKFAMVVSNTVGGAAGSPPPDRAAASDTEGTDAPLAESAVSSPAHPAEAIRPTYPAAARSQGVEGDVALVVVVGADGKVQGAEVEKRAGFGFDEAVLAAVRAARFEPARRHGHPVAVRMRLGYSFRLQ